MLSQWSYNAVVFIIVSAQHLCCRTWLHRRLRSWSMHMSLLSCSCISAGTAQTAKFLEFAASWWQLSSSRKTLDLQATAQLYPTLIHAYWNHAACNHQALSVRNWMTTFCGFTVHIADLTCLCLYRQELYRQTYTQLKPLQPQVQPGHTLPILPSFAKPQTLAASDGSMVFLEPKPYQDGAPDIVNHTADTFPNRGRDHSPKGKKQSTAFLRGKPVDMPQPQYTPVTRKDVVIAMTSSAHRQALWQM